MEREFFKQNLHIHTTFCDGKNTPEEIVSEAIRQGFTSIGFSGHIKTNLGDLTSKMEDEKGYITEVNHLKEKFKETLGIYLGAEFDSYSTSDPDDFEYVIGSVHVAEKDGIYFSFDKSLDKAVENFNSLFGGDGRAYYKAYYDRIKELPELFKFDIVGHFDLVTKYKDRYAFFDDESEEYKKTAIDALRTVAERKKIFELNTGAIARGYRKTPYPAYFLIKEMRAAGVEVVVTSDCHDMTKLSCGFDVARELLESAGYDHTLVFDGKSFTERGFK